MRSWVQKMHDIGKTGWWLLIVPVSAGVIVLIYWCLRDGEEQSNAFGSIPSDRQYETGVMEKNAWKWFVALAIGGCYLMHCVAVILYVSFIPLDERHLEVFALYQLQKIPFFAHIFDIISPI